MGKHSTLKKWFLCTPTDFTTKGAKNEQSWFNNELKSIAPDVGLHHWGDSAFDEMIARPVMVGKLLYFFGELELSSDWFQNQVAKQVANVARKFIPGLHVETQADIHAHYMIGDRYFTDTLSGDIQDIRNVQSMIYEANHGLVRFATDRGWENDIDSISNLSQQISEILNQVISLIERCCNLVMGGRIAEAQLIDIRPNLDQLLDVADTLYNMTQILYETKACEIPDDLHTRNWDIKSYRDYLRSKLFGPIYSYSEFEPIHSALQVMSEIRLSTKYLIGSAGRGKTHLVCHMCEERVNARFPAILIHGNQFGGSCLIEQQICKILDLPASYSWENFLNSLDSYARACRTRVLIAIDALNESMDTDLWQREFNGFVNQLSNYTNIALVTTCRDSYRESIFKNVKDSNVEYIDGFDNHNIEEATKRYFDYYNIRADLTLAPLEQFENPLYLKIFCETVNPERLKEKEVYLGEHTLFRVFGNFINDTGSIVCEQLSRPPKSAILQDALNRLALFLWEKNSRYIDYEDAIRLIDEEDIKRLDWNKSLIRVLLDEGMIINRNLIDRKEKILFTYDLFAGYIIAKSILNSLKKENISEFVQSDEFKMKLLVENYQDLHPLHEDILRCICALLPEYYGIHLYELLADRHAYTYSIDALFEMEPMYIGESQLAELSNLFNKDTSRYKLLERTHYTALNAKHPLNAKFIDKWLRALPMAERDTSWTEYILREAHYFMNKLDEFIGACQQAKTLTDIGKKRLGLAANYYKWFLTSSNRSLRDRATRALYMYGCHFPDDMLTLAHGSLGINDLYVYERLLAAAYGIAMTLHADPAHRVFTETILPRYARTFFNEVFAPDAPHSTTHALIRDYTRQFIEIAILHSPELLTDEEILFLRPPYSIGGIREWGESEDRNDDEYRDGNAPLQMDFLNYTLGGLVPGRKNYDFNDTDYGKVVRGIYWRIYDLGYTLERFGDIDKRICRYAPISRGPDNAGFVERYGKKYSWITFFELYGFRQDINLLIREWMDEGDNRISEIDIDPSFPNEPHDESVIDADFLGDRDLALQQWIEDGGNPDVIPYLVINNLLGSEDQWIMLNGQNNQEDGQSRRSRFTFVRAFLVPTAQTPDFVSMLSSQNLGNRWLPEISADHYTFAGETPWSANYPANGYTEMIFDGFRELTGNGDEVCLVRDGVILNESECASVCEELREVFGRPDRVRVILEFLDERGLGLKSKTETNFNVLIPVRKNNWELYHSGENPGQGVYIPAKEIATKLDLWIGLPSWDLFDVDGKRASISTDCGPWKINQGFCYIRKDLLDIFLMGENLSIVWAMWGERQVSFSPSNPYPPSDVNFNPHVVFQDIFVYDNNQVLKASQFVSQDESPK